MAKLEPAVLRYSIAGTWSDWAVEDMPWDGECFYYIVEVGRRTGNEWEAFTIFQNGDRNRRIYPSVKDASPDKTYKLRGPGPGGDGYDWLIGHNRGKNVLAKLGDFHDRMAGASLIGTRYKIKLFIDSKGGADQLTWDKYKDEVQVRPSGPSRPDCSVAMRQGTPPVRPDLARGFLSALEAEYVRHVRDSVGDFLNAHGNPEIERILTPFENRVRKAADKRLEIKAIASSWGLDSDAGVKAVASSSTMENAPVQSELAKKFLAALEAEYVRGVRNAVGKFFDQHDKHGVERILSPFEDQVRSSSNPAREIEALTRRWSVSASKPPDVKAASPSSGYSSQQFVPSATVSIDAQIKQICSALSLSASTPQRTVILQGLAAQDLEVVRKSLAIAPHVGLVGSAEVRSAEARLRNEMQLPPDWDMSAFATGRFLRGGSGGRQSSAVVAFQRQTQAIETEMQSLFDATYRKVYTRDRRGVPVPDRFVVREVYRVMNDQVWREYAGCRDELRARLKDSRPTVPDGTQTEKHLATRGRVTHLPELDAAVNEQWLFHGTTKDAAVGIAENDFRLDLTGANAGTLYGKGIYLAENVSKSDEYGEGPKGAAGEELEQGAEAPRPPPREEIPLVRESYILMCRTALGRVLYTDALKPDPDLLQQSCLRGDFDSVCGDRLKRNGTFRELVVYNDDHVYPEYIVKYERIFFHERFAEIYKAMTQRKKRGHFNGPIDKELEVLDSLWNVYGMPNKGRINKWQLLDLLKAIGQPPENEEEDLDATFKEWDTKKDGWIDRNEFISEMTQRVNDGMDCNA